MRTPRLPGRTVIVATVLGLLLGVSGRAHADLALTQAGIDQGFALSTFASGFPTGFNTSYGPVGPLGIAFTPSGGVLVSDDPGNVRLFPTDTNGQKAGMAPVGQNYGMGNAAGLTQMGNRIYMTQQANGAVVQVNPNGTLSQTIVTGLPHATGIVANPVTGQLFVSTADVGASPQVFLVDPATKTANLFVKAQLDGLTISPDGKTLYGASGSGTVVGYDTATGKLVFQSGVIPGHVDGVALGAGTLAGEIFANTNAGTVVEVNLTTGAQTIIAQGGSRGDFAVVDPNPNQNSVLLTQSDSVVRLAPPPGGGFVPGVGPDIPEPSSLALIGVGLAALVGWRWRRLRPSAN